MPSLVRRPAARAALFALLGLWPLLAPTALAGPNTVPPEATTAFPLAAAQRQIQAHTQFLAHDLLEGRGTGTRGFDLAAEYVAAQFLRLGLEPAGEDGTFFQPVTLVRSQAAPDVGEFKLTDIDTANEFVVGTDVIVRTADGEAEASVSGEAVFVGFGIQAPELGHDDFAHVDLTGKIAVVLRGAPEHFPINPGAHFSDLTVKRDALARQGAIGVVMLSRPRDEARTPWPVNLARAHFPRMGLVGPDGAVVDAFPELRVRALLGAAASARLLAVAGRDYTAVVEQANRGETVSFPLGFGIAMASRATLERIVSNNVLARLPGAEPAQAAAPVVVTGHLDHIGVGPAVEGDRIYNGAMDNAVGIGVLLAAAERLSALPPPARPVLFAALTAEEMGLLGAMHLAQHPPAGVQSYAANINLDMPLFPAEVRDVIGYGADHSTLGATLAQIAPEHGFTVSPDEEPQEVIFVRSDQYAFILGGVPSLYLSTGVRSRTDDPALKAASDDFMRRRYHRPSDDLDQPIDWESTAAFAQLATAFIRTVADAEKAPAWYEGDFFGEQFAPTRDRAPRPAAAVSPAPVAAGQER